MAQRQYSASSNRSSRKQRKSDFPIFEYIDMLMPQNLAARFRAMPRAMRWTIISIAASLVLLWVFLSVVVGGLNYLADTSGAFLNDSYYLPYSLTDRPLPVYRGAVTPGANQSLILPQTIDNQYVLHVSPSEAELKVMQKTELEAFLALSLPVADSLTALRQSLGEQTGEAAASDTEQSSEAAVTTPATEGEVQATPDVVQLQVTALDNLLPTLTSLNQALQASDSLAQVYGSTAQWLQSQVNTIAGTGIAMPPETEAFVQQINALSSMEKPVYYSNNECLMASLSARWGNSNIDNAPCTISNRAMYVEQGDYVGNNGPSFNVVAAEFPTPVAAGWAVKQLFYRARFIGFTGDFALDDIIEYNYFFSQIDGVYTLAWSHDNWVYSISSTSSDQIDTIIKVFPF